jgi:hypothetical protein
MGHQEFLSEWVRHRTRALALTRLELTQRASCSVSALPKIEINERRPSKQLADCLRLPLGDHPTFVHAARGEFCAHLPLTLYVSKSSSHLISTYPFRPRGSTRRLAPT